MLCNASEDFRGIGAGEVVLTPPTDKQIRAANVISRVLGLRLPAEYSKLAYWRYIKENQEKSLGATIGTPGSDDDYWAWWDELYQDHFF